jgi:alpha-galactosidase
VRWEAVVYHDYPTVEWTLWLENAGPADTPLLENIQALDTRLERTGGNEFILHHFKGSLTTPTDYEPYQTTVGAKQEKRIATSGGRPTNSALCYFNLEWQREGVIIALGWPGQWAAQFTRDEGRGLRVQAGQELTHFKLHPGEKVRTPLVALQFWKGDWIGAQNIWRRWMLAHNVPRSGGTPLGPATWGESADWTGYTGTDEANQEFSIARYLEEGIKIDYWEMDAGWYVNNGTWVNTGTWEPDPKRFPHGLRPLFDYAHARGLKTHIWFELERVTRGTWLWEKHPEWLLKCPEGERDGRRLLNLGDPRAYQWVIEILDKYITEGIDFYRTDFNIDPLPYWRAHDAPDRQGITEIRYVTAFLAYFDELLRRHPNILLDTCASGGSRNDLETLRRAVPITRSDYNSEPVGGQNITYGIALWIPCYGSGTLTADPYFIRSTWSPRYGFGWDMRRRDLDYDFLRDVVREWRSVADYYFGDFCPLTPYHATNGVWMAWQFDRPDRGEGMVQAFRRTDSPLESARFQLRGLEPDARYAVTDLDVPGSREMTGRELMDEGLPVLIKVQPAAAVITYKRVEAVQK